MQAIPDFVDLEEILKEGSSAFELAKAAGKEDEAKEIYFRLENACKKTIENSSSVNKLIRDLDSQYYLHIEEGANLLKGAPLSILSEVQYKPSIYCQKIVEKSKRNGGLVIGTCTDIRVAKKFIEINKIPDCAIASFSELDVKKEKFTGKLKRYNGPLAKMNNYKCGNVIGDGLENIGVFWKANEKNYKVYVAESGNKSVLTEMALKKLKIPYSLIKATSHHF